MAPNLLARNFTVDAPNKVWTGDIPYIWTEEGWHYLAVGIDLFNRQGYDATSMGDLARALGLTKSAIYRRDL